MIKPLNIIKEPILVTFPRSGINWVRYVIEFFSNRRTSGKTRIIEKGKPIVTRVHDAKGIFFDKKIFNDKGYMIYPFLKNKNESNYSKMIIILRSPFENYVSWNKNLTGFEYYFTNIECYDEFKGDKILLYYEDLISNKKEFLKILDFIGVDYRDKIDKFISDYDSHVQKSKNVYNNIHKNRIRGDANKLKDFEKQELVDFIDSKYPIIKDKYLNRYF